MRVAGRLLFHAGWWAFVIYLAFWLTDSFYGTDCYWPVPVRTSGSACFNKIDGKLGFYLFMMWPVVFAMGCQLYGYCRREWPWLPVSMNYSWQSKRMRVQIAIFFAVGVLMMTAFQARVGPFRLTEANCSKAVDVSCGQ